jgi:hypothetical protein
MTARRFRIGLFFVIVTSLATPACYTLLKHPTIDRTGYEETLDSRCTSCHSEDEILSYVHAPRHPVYPPEDGDWYEYPWWWEHYWFFVPSGPGGGASALRGVRPGSEKDPNHPVVGGTVAPPPGPKAIGGDVRVKDPDDKGKGENDDKPDSEKNKDKDRPVRPKSNKGKEDG